MKKQSVHKWCCWIICSSVPARAENQCSAHAASGLPGLSFSVWRVQCSRVQPGLAWVRSSPLTYLQLSCIIILAGECRRAPTPTSCTTHHVYAPPYVFAYMLLFMPICTHCCMATEFIAAWECTLKMHRTACYAALMRWRSLILVCTPDDTCFPVIIIWVIEVMVFFIMLDVQRLCRVWKHTFLHRWMRFQSRYWLFISICKCNLRFVPWAEKFICLEFCKTKLQS